MQQLRESETHAAIAQLSMRLQSLDTLAESIERISQRLDLLSRGSILPLSKSFALDANAWAGLLNVTPRSVGRAAPEGNEPPPDCRLQRVGVVRPGSRWHYTVSVPSDGPPTETEETTADNLR